MAPGVSSLWRTVDWDRSDWRAVGHRVGGTTLALGVAKGALYLAALGLSRPEPPRTRLTEDETESLASDPAESEPTPVAPVCDHTLRLIAQAGLPPLNLSVQVHHWLDAKQSLMSRGELTTGIDQRDRTVQANSYGTERGPIHQVKYTLRIASLRLAMPDRYRIDFRGDQGDRHPRTIACDGERLRKIYHNRVIASPAKSLPTDFVTLVDPA